MALVDNSVEYYLEQWGAWCRRGRPGPAGAPSWMGKMLDGMAEQNDNPGQDDVVFSIEDGEAEKIDGVVRRLGQHKPRARDDLILYYVRRMNARQMGKHLRISKDSALDRVKEAISRVDSMIAVLSSEGE